MKRYVQHEVEAFIERSRCNAIRSISDFVGTFCDFLFKLFLILKKIVFKKKKKTDLLIVVEAFSTFLKYIASNVDYASRVFYLFIF